MSLIQNLSSFLEKSFSPYHVVSEVKKQLNERNFQALSADQSWNLEAGQGYYLVKDESSVLAWYMPKDTTQVSLRLIGTHTDSPGFLVRPNPTQTEGNAQVLGVETYGGPLLYTWLDRPLALSGRVVYFSKESNSLESKLVHIPSFAIIPSLAIHLLKDRETLNFNPHTHLRPIWNIQSKESLSSETTVDAFHAFLRKWCQSNLGIDDFYSYDLFLTPCTKVDLIGQEQELFAAAHLDNLASSFLAINSLQAQDSSLNMTALFMHEEIGSTSPTGANSSFVESTLSRIVKDNEEKQKMLSRSFFISADGAHAIHPNYPEAADTKNTPLLGQGFGLKKNARQRYTTDAISAAVITKLCQDNKIDFQYFVNRSDYPCGSTIGPYIASRLSIYSADIGVAMLGMHSVKETCATADLKSYAQLLKAFYNADSIGI